MAFAKQQPPLLGHAPSSTDSPNPCGRRQEQPPLLGHTSGESMWVSPFEKALPQIQQQIA
jgi:hypothetical protein